ncbi:MAG: dihydropteroate synthase [Chloroflexi bacterium]|nr:dihydropteroate synthase [Chloroflexota bacterium]MDA1241395.1 dihydropteroate synthase [Chloroflexota bacterium]
MLLRLRDREIDCTLSTRIMAILNVSDDSPITFSRVGVGQALDRAADLARRGAAIIDIGAHSTATGARELTAQEEIERVCPVIEAVTREGLVASVDTWTPSVARAAAEAGVHLLNDVTGFTAPEMVDVAAEFGLPGCVMHMRGAPKHHREVSQEYDDVEVEVRGYLVARAAELAARGVTAWLDPGYAFGKSAEDNLRLLNGLPALVASGYPVLISASRKGFLAEVMGNAYSQRSEGLLEATVAFNVLAAWHGVHVVRVHDVHEVAHALAVVDAARRVAAERDA